MSNYTLITGATSGIGFEMAKYLSVNRRLVLVGRDTEKLRHSIESLKSPERHKSILVDLNADRGVLYNLLTDYIVSNGIEVDSFIHCAGATKILPLKNFDIESIDRIFNVNLFSAIEIIKALLRKHNHFALQNIIFISSLWSIRGQKGNSMYASAKGAINSLVYSLSKELAPKIRVNAILPGAVETPMTADIMNGEYGKAELKDYPLGYGKCSDIVNSVEFLLSDKARWITGQTISVDGGRSIL
jgi:NAD(P)-dependent dehydrogenase (short-subunit alcohol dehydrogenase family)